MSAQYNSAPAKKKSTSDLMAEREKLAAARASPAKEEAGSKAGGALPAVSPTKAAGAKRTSAPNLSRLI